MKNKIKILIALGVFLFILKSNFFITYAETAFDPQPEEIIYETSIRETPSAAVLGEVRKRDNTSTSIVKNNSQSSKVVLGARKGQTDDIIPAKKRYAIIIGCIATIALLSYIDIIRKKEEKENNQDLSS